MNVRAELERKLSEALRGAGAGENAVAMVALSARAQFGDYQANGAMAAAKQAKTNPRALAEQTVAIARESLGDMVESLEVAGPGFINIKLSGAWLASRCDAVAGDERLGVPQPDAPQTVVVDSSSPNLAKEMHIGHLRPTILSDAVARILGFLGHRTVRQNHVGDWGTQFGMLIACMEEIEAQSGPRAVTALQDLDTFYRQARAKFDSDPEFARRAREAVVRLQSGEEGALRHWRGFVDISLRHAEALYERMGVDLHREDVRGESAYNRYLPGVVQSLREQGLLTESQGAQCVFLEEFRIKDGDILPVIVQKSDGGYLYATTDLAAIRFRCGMGKTEGVVDWSGDRVLYFTDVRQTLHFQQIFAVARAARFAPEGVSLEYVPFGTIMGPDNRPFKTREGEPVRLVDVLNESVQRARALVDEKNPDLPESDRDAIASAVGIGAVKYFDLAHNRTSDYVFAWERMLAMEGNTAPYMQYAYTRVRSIFRKGLEQGGTEPGSVAIAEPAERALALKLLQFPETIASVAAEAYPHLLCNYLFELAGAFMSFYESCPVLQAATDALRASRLALADLTARTLQTGLRLLGIETVERM